MLTRDDNAPRRPWLDDALARFAARNNDVELQTRSLLACLLADARRHARLINTLSMLEHIGSHKIMVTQHASDIDEPTLKHVAEEAHHAYFMKRQAERAAQRPMEYVDGDLLAPASARMYFPRLEAALLRTLHRQHSSRAAYLYMSMIVEFRALWFYRLYDQALKRARHVMSLKRVLGEEQVHLCDIANRLDISGELSDARTTEFLGVEGKLFGRLLNAMQRSIA